MTTYNEIRKINVNEHVEKKGKFNYLSWSWAVDQLLQLDPTATWAYAQPNAFPDGSMMVFCTVRAFGKEMTSMLPVMNNVNKAIPNPNAMEVNTAMQRCLVKAIALHGLGLYIYAGEDLPEETPVDLTETAYEWTNKIGICASMEELQKVYKEAYTALKQDPNSVQLIANAKDIKKVELTK